MSEDRLPLEHRIYDVYTETERAFVIKRAYQERVINSSDITDYM